MDIVTKNLVSSFKEEESLSTTLRIRPFSNTSKYLRHKNECERRIYVGDIHTGG